MSAEVNNSSTGPERPTRWCERLLASLEKMIQSPAWRLKRWQRPAWLLKLFRRLMDTLRILWLAGWCTVLFAVGAVFFLVNDQGLDFLRRLAEPGDRYAFLANLSFFVGVLTWSLSTWYCARLLVTRKFPHMDEDFFERTKSLRTWLPRAGGSMVPLVIAVGFLHATWGKADAPAYPLFLLYILVFIVLTAALWTKPITFRGRTFSGITFRGMQLDSEPDAWSESLPSNSRCVLLVSYALSLGLMVSFLIFPVGLPSALGAPAILLFAITFWILVGSMIITYLPLVNGYPSLTLPLFLAVLLMSTCNDNHTIRTTDIKTVEAPRQSPEAHFGKWLEDRLRHSTSTQPYPVFVVAAAGGGIRAAYWTASVLSRIADENRSAWSDHLYAMSTVSGGSVGAALHAAQIAEFVSAQPGSSVDIPAEMQARARYSLDNDILSPVVSYLLFPDLLQRFLPYPFSFTDRARAIELALEAAVAEPQGVKSGRFARRFVELWPEDLCYRVPVLLLNTTVVETGQRAILSNLRIDDTFSDAFDLLDDSVSTQNMPLSTAAHLSARFTYVSPAGTIPTRKGGVWGHIVDGGYFENSGAATAIELMQRMRKVADAVEKEYSRKVPLMLILIRNDPKAPSVCNQEATLSQPFEPSWYLNEILSPVRALLSTRVARGRLAELSALNLVRSFHGSQENVQSPRCRDGCVFEFSLGGADREHFVEPPLGWSLSARARALMDEHLETETHQDKFACIRRLLSGSECLKEPVCQVRR